MDEFFVSRTAPTVRAALRQIVDPAVAAVRLRNLWYGGCTTHYKHLITQACRTREPDPVPELRCKIIMRPEGVRLGYVHGPGLKEGRRLMVPDWQFLVMHHYRTKHYKNEVSDSVMLGAGPNVRAELRRVYPQGIPCIPHYNKHGCCC